MNRPQFPLFLMVAAVTLFSAMERLDADVVLTQKEYELGLLINQHRVNNGLAEIPVTVSLTDVAQKHVLDLHVYEPDSHPDCNLHSWSANGNWTPVCYTADHANAAGMWNKPREITNNIYTVNGYEISVTGASISPETAFNAWLNSPGHNDVMLNQGIWSSLTWEAIGIGMYEDHANVWFGEQVDPQGNAMRAVPEPSSALPLLMGLAATAFARRKKRAKNLAG